MSNIRFDQFRRDTVVTTLPTTLTYGEEVYYKDTNGNLILFVGHQDGTAWPVSGVKEYVALFNAAIPINLRVLLNTTGLTLTTSISGSVTRLDLAGGATFNLNKTTFSILPGSNSGYNDDNYLAVINNNSNIFGSSTTGITMANKSIGTPGDDPFGIYDLESTNNLLHIRIYP